jgi:hypothetical protein
VRSEGRLQMIECLREWGVKNKDYWRLAIEFRDGAWEIALWSSHPARGTKTEVGVAKHSVRLGMAWPPDGHIRGDSPI